MAVPGIVSSAQSWTDQYGDIVTYVDRLTGRLTSTALTAAGLPGATAASRYAGATASGAPTSGTFAAGDYVVDQTGPVWVCTVAGSPGTWTQAGGSGSGLPAPSGTAQAGGFPVASGAGTATTWNGAVLFAPAPSGDQTGGTDGTAVQALISALNALGGGKVILSPGSYWGSLTAKTGVYVEGAGIGATTWNLPAGANTDVIGGYGFSSLTMGGTGSFTGGSGISDFGFASMTIDGNGPNQTAVSYGARWYGYQWTLRDLDVRNCYTTGLWTEWGPLQGNAPAASDGSESTVANVRSHGNGVHGWVHLGPSDVRMSNVLCFQNNTNLGASGIGFWALNDTVSNVMSTASAMNGTSAGGFTGTFTVQAAALGGATDLYAAAGTLTVATSSGTATMTYAGKTATTFTGCAVTSGSGTFATGNTVVSAAARFTTNGLQLSACHSWGNNHTWACVLDSQVSETGSHWEGAQYGQLLIRNASNKAGGFVYDFSTTATGMGIQLGDNGATPGVPLSASIAANSCDIRTRASAFLMDTAARSALNWVNANQCSADVLAVAKSTGAYSTTLTAGSNGTDLSAFTSGSPGTLYVSSTQQIPNGAGTVTIATAHGSQTATFTGTNGSNGGSQGASRASGNQITGVVAAAGVPSGSTMSTGGAVALSGIGSVAVGGTANTTSRVRVLAQSPTLALSTAASQVQELGPRTHDLGSAANGFRLRANGTDQANLNTAGSQMQWPNGIAHLGYSGNYGTPTWQIAGATGIVTGAALAASGLTGTTAGGRYVGATASGAPSAGTFLAGDFANDLTGHLYLCTAPGTPGTWATLAGAVSYAAPASYQPANPTATASASLVMMGLGGTCAYTPLSSGKVLATFTGLLMNTTSGDSVNITAYWGTGAAPANGAASTGTAWGAGVAGSMSVKSAGAALGTPFTLNQVLTLTPSTACWLDLGVSANGGGTAEVTNITGTFTEVP